MRTAVERVVRGWGWVSRVAHELDEAVIDLCELLFGNTIDFLLNSAQIKPVDFLQPYKISRRHNPLPIIHLPRLPRISNKHLIKRILLRSFQPFHRHPNLINPTLPHNRCNQLRHFPYHMHMIMPIDV